MRDIKSECRGQSDGYGENDYFVLDRASFNQGKNAKYNIKIERGGQSPTLVARGPHAVAIHVQHGAK